MNTMYRECYTHISGGDPGALGLPPSIFMGLRNSSYGTVSVPRAMSWGKDGAPLPLVRGEGFRVTATSRGRTSSGMSPPGPGRRAARRLFILRYLTNIKRSTKCVRDAGWCENGFILTTMSNLQKTETMLYVGIVRLTSPVLPESEQRCSWLHEDSLPSASCHDTCMSCTCCAEEAKERHQVLLK